MVTVSQITQKLIEDNILFQEAVSTGIVNYTLLAKNLKPDVEKIYRNKVKLSAITRAVQRYAEINHEKHYIEAIRSSRISRDTIQFFVRQQTRWGITRFATGQQ